MEINFTILDLIKANPDSNCKHSQHLMTSKKWLCHYSWVLSGRMESLSMVIFRIWLFAICLLPGKQSVVVQVKVWFYRQYHTQLVLSFLCACFQILLLHHGLYKYLRLQDFSWAHRDFCMNKIVGIWVRIAKCYQVHREKLNYFYYIFFNVKRRVL